MTKLLAIGFLMWYIVAIESYNTEDEEIHSEQQKPGPSSSPHESNEKTVQEQQERDLENQASDYFKYPPKCKPGYCDYEAKWSYDHKSDFVTFTITAKVGRAYWSGIGFSEKKDGHLSDLVTGYLRKYRQHFLLDDRHVEYKKSYKVDAQQDAVLISHSYKNGKLTYTFKRKRYTGDKFDTSLEKCVYLKFIWGAMAFPEYLPYKEKMEYFSQKKVCVGPVLPEDPCRKMYCIANSYCVHNGVNVKCKCRPGYHMKGDRCSKYEAPMPHVDPCRKMYCKQHEYCKAYDDRAKCVCKPEYKGKHSECMDEMMPDEYGK